MLLGENDFLFSPITHCCSEQCPETPHDEKSWQNTGHIHTYLNLSPEDLSLWTFRRSYHRPSLCPSRFFSCSVVNAAQDTDVGLLFPGVSGSFGLRADSHAVEEHTGRRDEECVKELELSANHSCSPAAPSKNRHYEEVRKNVRGSQQLESDHNTPYSWAIPPQIKNCSWEIWRQDWKNQGQTSVDTKRTRFTLRRQTDIVLYSLYIHILLQFLII